ILLPSMEPVMSSIIEISTALIERNLRITDEVERRRLDVGLTRRLHGHVVGRGLKLDRVVTFSFLVFPL
ncbi:MAG: hypothetical protein ACWGMY_04240, partial [Hyphomicrobiaceae bacterium]